ncbi:MAG: aminoacyl-tRNA hydrolase [Brumimicrobium sp.]|nr:aminoacyl-tRNA hydrolase [Brumimicrobium sp.]
MKLFSWFRKTSLTQDVPTDMKYLIVGLGNPGEKYENTRHNIGFKVVEAIAKEKDATFDTAKLGDVATVKWKGRTMILLKPNTYMNLSGKAVNYYMQSEKIDIENILVVVDDLALPFGKLRLRGKGSDGGHNGLKDIQEKLNSQNYARLRFGVGNEFSKGHQVDYVLGEWNEQEIKQMDDRIKVAVDIIKSFSTIGLNRTMSAWNNK